MLLISYTNRNKRHIFTSLLLLNDLLISFYFVYLHKNIFIVEKKVKIVLNSQAPSILALYLGEELVVK